MFRHIGQFILVFLATVFVIQSNAYSKDVTCETLATCEAQVITAMNAGTDRMSHVRYFDVSRAFSKFGQDGFDVLFTAMENASGDRKSVFLAALSYMKNDMLSLKSPEVSRSQFKTLTKMWFNENSDFYSLTGLINHADTTQSHAFIIKELQSTDEDRRYWVEQVIKMEGFGDGESTIEVKYLAAIVDLIENKNFYFLVPTLTRFDTPLAEMVLWSLLNSSDERVFGNAYEILSKEHGTAVNDTIKAQSFANTPLEAQRALMIATTITTYRNRPVTHMKAYDYWKDWFEASDTSETERMIPAYMLFDLFEKSNTEFLKTKDPSEVPILGSLRGHFGQDELQTRDDYFQIYAVMKSFSDAQTNIYKRYEGLPFEGGFYDLVQTPELWAKRLWSYISETSFETDVSLIRAVGRLEADTNKLKSFFLNRLESHHSDPEFLSMLTMILQKQALREDREVRAAVRNAAKKSPFTRLRVAASYADSDTPLPQEFDEYYFRSWFSSFSDSVRTENIKQQYCEVKSTGTSGYMNVQPDLNIPRTEPEENQLHSILMTVQTPSGYLAGFNSGEFGGGLVYYSDITAEGKLLPLSFARNVIAIVESETAGVYWVLAGLNHMVPGRGIIHRVDARSDGVVVMPYKRMIAVPRQTEFLKSGDLYMDFRPSSVATYDGVVTKIREVNNVDYNPPVILTRSGELIIACEN